MASAQEQLVVERARARIGTVLKEKWTLDGLLGVGGMAAVYSATHRNGKRVAVKVLREEFSHDEQVRTRFLREGYAANALQDDGAVSVLDDDIAADGSAFIVMELLEGETLEARWERAGNSIPVADLLVVVDGLLRVLGTAHSRNVVHRDIKPDNLFVTRGGALKVLDFGIAKVFEAEPEGSRTTRAGTIMGTPAYMAPEQARARWEEVDARTDLWAVGATMFMLLSGRHVHEAQSGTDQLIKNATCPAPPLQSVAPGVPAVVAAIVDRALAFDRNARWPDAATMRSAVRGALEALGGMASSPADETSVSSSLGYAGIGGDLPSRVTALTPSTKTVQSAGLVVARPSASSVDEEGRETDVSKLRAAVTDIQGRLAAARARVAAAQGTVEAARRERGSLARWFQRQAGTRTAAVEQARAQIRRCSIVLAREALSASLPFDAELRSACANLASLENAAASAARDVKVHEAALSAYDAHAVRVGVATFVGLLLALAVCPYAWRIVHAVVMPMVLRLGR
ncbi:MAG: serine/threonine-protein kinase [Polyangiaceae bacterium]|jgi:serine/threonine-protein kinase